MEPESGDGVGRDLHPVGIEAGRGGVAEHDVQQVAGEGLDHRPAAAEAMTAYCAHAIGPDAVARAVSFALAQPAEVDVNEIVVRPARQR